jgi:Glycosyltransferases involved in cell wall biogenesis
MRNLKIGVLIPCFNEEKTIGSVVKKLQNELPDADIYVYDNNSNDRTSDVARASGAVLRFEGRQGKGFVVRRMFADIEADIYVLIDGDDTYDVTSVHKLIDYLCENNLDMVVGARIPMDDSCYPPGHTLGNKMFTRFVSLLFRKTFTDIFSGYRVFSRRFVKTFPCTSRGFEIELELTIRSLEMELPVGEINAPYYARPIGSESKLSTIKDGSRILLKIFLLLKELRPVLFFSTISAIFFICSLVLAFPLLKTYIDTGLVPRFPTAILSTGLMILAFLSLFLGVLLDSVSRSRKEVKYLAYLSNKSTSER